MTFFTEERAKLTLDRTKKNFDDAVKYAQKHEVGACLAVATLFVATLFYPAPVILTLAIAALVLLAFNAIKEDSWGESFSRGCSSLANSLGL